MDRRLSLEIYRYVLRLKELFALTGAITIGQYRETETTVIEFLEISLSRLTLASKKLLWRNRSLKSLGGKLRAFLGLATVILPKWFLRRSCKCFRLEICPLFPQEQIDAAFSLCCNTMIKKKTLITN